MGQDQLRPYGAPRTVAITGAGGFIGRYLLRHLSEQADTRIRLLSRHPKESAAGSGEISVMAGDLRDAESLDGFLVRDCTVINLAYAARSSRAANLAAARNLINACVKHRVKRLIHCSTAVVFGRSPDETVTEDSVCIPHTEYGVTKLMIEELIKQEARGFVELIIVRPTAVFGPGGQGLLKLSGQLLGENRLTNYLRSCLFNRRAMNLVCVENVSSALDHLARLGGQPDGETFIISQDEEPGNDFRSVERVLLGHFGLSDHSVPRLPLPAGVLSGFLRLRGLDVVKPNRRYDSTKLHNTGFRTVFSLESGLRKFGQWYLAECAD